MNILITGATGFVGRNLINRIAELDENYEITILVLPYEKIPDSYKDLDLNVIEGNIINPEDVNNAVRGKDIIIHLAGLISYWKYDIPKLNAVNVNGVRNIVNAAIGYGVKRFVHISSVGAVGFNPDGSEADEETSYNWPDSLPYMTTKKAGEDIVSSAVKERGLNAVILNPASIMGPGDPVADTAHNQIYGNIYKSPFFFGSFTGGLAVVDVRDLCSAIISAIENGDSGERFLIVGANVKYSKVLELIGKYSGKTVIPFPIPPFLLVAAGLIMEFISGITKKRPLITAGYGKLSGWLAYYSNKKSIETLNIKYENIEKTIEDGCRYYENAFL